MIYISKYIFRPYMILCLTNMLSFLAWLFPSLDMLRKGFEVSRPIFSFGSFAYFTSLTLIIAVSYLTYTSSGFFFQNKTSLEIKNQCMVSNKIYFLAILIAGVGLLDAIMSVLEKASFMQLLVFISSGQANEIKYLLYEDYSVGLASLRYCVIISSAFLLYRRLCSVKMLYLDMTAVILLLASSLMSSRLTFIASIVGGLYLYFYFKKRIKINIVKFILLLLLVFSFLSLLNWSRNSGYYENRELSFFSGGISEIITYLGSPVQGAMTAFEFADKISELDDFYRLSTIELNLNTNSSFHIYISNYGYVGVLWLTMAIGVISLAIGIFERYECGRYVYINIPLIYSLAEFWRLPIFSEGIIITLIACALLISFVGKYNIRFDK
ncbi:hypothetical protein [Aeromonas veronii]|uniref:hypothetical protein n=2 Tax=Aeromonas veronii TaxID=654 RepID=UPI001920208D|nr:hypothetical protein [Aeromonas veronii]MBL0588330.1 hypothetical protein [Aeromonas veronii]